MVDQLIADLYVLDNRARKDLFAYVKTLKENYSESSRMEDLKKIEYKYQDGKCKYQMYLCILVKILYRGYFF